MIDRRTLRTVLVACVLLFGADRLTKELARHYLDEGAGGRAIPITKEVFYLRLSENSAGFFGFLDGLPEGARPPIFIAASLLFAGLLIYLIRKAAQERKGDEVLALTLILGGALGNGFDRLAYGAVIDCMFLIVGESFRTYLNLADLAILVGILWMFRLHLWPPAAARSNEGKAEG